MAVGIEREGDRHLARVDPALQLAQAAPAADEIDALVGARVGDAEDRLDQVARQQRDRQARDRVVLGQRIGQQLQPIPAPPRNMPTSEAAAGRTGDGEA